MQNLFTFYYFQKKLIITYDFWDFYTTLAPFVFKTLKPFHKILGHKARPDSKTRLSIPIKEKVRPFQIWNGLEIPILSKILIYYHILCTVYIRFFFFNQMPIVISCIRMSFNCKLTNAQVVTKCFKMCVLRKIAPNSTLKFMVLKNPNGQRIGKMTSSRYFPILDWFSLFFARYFWFLL